MNVQSITRIRITRRNGLVHRWRMLDDVGRMRCIRYRWLFEHVTERAKSVPIEVGDSTLEMGSWH